MNLENIISAKVTLFALPIFFIAILIEITAKKLLNARGTLNSVDDSVSIFMGLMSVVTNGAAAFITLGMLLWAEQFKVFDLPLTLTVIIACFILDDLRYYLHHRIAHRCRWPWAMHIIHHSSQRYSLAVALRQGWTKHFTGTTVLKIPLVLVGFNPILVIFCGALNAVYQFFLHTETVHKLPKWFEAIFNTPSHHRVHHGKNPEYLDSNYAGTLIIWDKIFGTFVPESENAYPDYGLVKDFETFNPFKIFIHEYWSILKDVFGSKRSLKDRLLYIVAPPGWSHDNSRKTSKDIKREYYKMLKDQKI
ncbi:sterol desaturase family protein [Hellea sp.]|nr:sterol desaturase family protein [Hellea sp.]MDA8889024.1 sterol desaturase family protein [Hellea sp.]MDB4845458.1 sterol desaturase family protein [Hellea sp.]MDC0422638.1 sterol desaturase family protein [Hellea sp.]MDC1089579.1 sterol desaturase family protein [Hellea sp.]